MIPTTTFGMVLAAIWSLVAILTVAGGVGAAAQDAGIGLVIGLPLGVLIVTTYWYCAT